MVGLATKMLYRHRPQVVGERDERHPPKPGDLAPHEQGAMWTRNLLELSKHIVKADRNAIFFSLLARHCSDVAVEGEALFGGAGTVLLSYIHVMLL